MLKCFFYICLGLAFSSLEVFAQVEGTSLNISTIDQTNIHYLSPLLRLPDRSLVEQGKLSISLSNSLSKSSLLKGLLDKRKEQLEGGKSLSLLDLSLLQEYYKNSYPKEDIELEIELSLFNSGKLVKGQIKYLKSSDTAPSLEILQIPPTAESGLGNYIFAQNGAKSVESPLSILSPVTKKCRDIPAEGRGDPILLSGLSMADIFFRLNSEGPFVFTSVLKEELLVPESRLIREEELKNGAKLVSDVEKFVAKEVQLVSARASSKLYARSSELIHLDVKNGLPYQIQFLIEGTNKKGAVIYSWIQFEDGASVPRQISYYESNSSNQYEIVSRMDTVGISIPKSGGVDAFKSELNKLCANQ